MLTIWLEESTTTHDWSLLQTNLLAAQPSSVPFTKLLATHWICLKTETTWALQNYCTVSLTCSFHIHITFETNRKPLERAQTKSMKFKAYILSCQNALWIDLRQICSETGKLEEYSRIQVLKLTRSSMHNLIFGDKGHVIIVNQITRKMIHLLLFTGICRDLVPVNWRYYSLEATTSLFMILVMIQNGSGLKMEDPYRTQLEIARAKVLKGSCTVWKNTSNKKLTWNCII